MDRRIFFNLDDTHFFYTRVNDGEMNEQVIRDFIRQYEGSQISDFALCCAGRIADFPSRVRDSWIDKYGQFVENGIDVDYTRHPVVKTAYRIFEELGLDFYEICIDELRRIGVRPWLSVRMNDCHCNDEPASFLHPSFYHEHPELRRVTHREPLGYFDRCYDYAQEEVRQMMLDFIEETLNRYDTDGIELDWQREIHCFRIGHEWEGLEILTKFMRQVRLIADRAEEKWGHRILIGVRALPSPQAALDCGFDVVRWAREGLADVIVPCPRWETTDPDIPVEMWRRLLKGTDATLAPGIELLLKPTKKSPFLYTTPENVNALAAQYLSMGADEVYLYNYFDRLDTSGNQTGERAAVHEKHYMKLLHTIGSMDTLRKAERSHVVSYTDIGPVWYSAGKHAPLPITLHRSNPEFIRVRVGEIPAGAKVEIRLGMDAVCGQEPEVYANSDACRLVRTEKVEPAFTVLPALVYEVVNDGRLPPFIVIEMIARNGEIAVDYAEVRVIPQIQ